MKKLNFLLIAALMIFASCNKDEITNGSAGQYGSLTASIEQGNAKSRLVVKEDNTLEWTEGDVIRVIMEDGIEPGWYDYKYIGNDDFSPVDQAVPEGTTNGEVKGVLYEGCNDEGSSVGGSVSGTTLETAFAQNTTFVTSPENSIMLPMWGTWNDGHISFKHLAGILRVDLTDLPVGYDMLSVIASNPIANTFIVEDITVDEPVLVVKEEGENLVNIKFNATTDNDRDKTLYIPLPVGTYESIQVLVSKYDEDLSEGEFQDPVYLATWKNKTVERATIYTAAVAYKEVATVQDLNEALQSLNVENKNAHIVVSEEVSSTNEVTIPEVENANVTLDFSNVADYASLTINSGNGESAASTQNIMVNVGNEVTESVTLDLNTPTSTVELGNGNFSTITATTATNTLIIHNIVAIQQLNILGGNVWIEVGTQIGNINNTGGGEIIYFVKNEAGLKEAFGKSGKYMLYDDIVIEDKNGLNVGNGNKVILDLNNKTITAEGNAFVVETGGTLMLNGNGFVKAGNTVGSWVALRTNGGTIIVNDGNYSVGLDNGDSNSCVYVKNGGQVTINGGTFSHEVPTSGNNYGLPLQVNNDDTQGKITVNGGVFVLDNDRYYEQQDKDAGKIVITAGETKDNGKMIVSGATGKPVVIENVQLSDALYTLYGDQYFITINSNGYAEMKESEVLAINRLDLDSYGYDYNCSITSLSGIEHFVNLEHLDCRNSGLKECDFSKNVKLRTVGIQHTTELKSLDFSNNPEIDGLYLNYNSGLSSLNLTGCNNLLNLQLYGSALTSLDIPNKAAMDNLLFGGSLILDPADYPNLTGLGCENMELTTLDGFIPETMKGQLTYLSCDNNNLTEIDLSQYPRLTDLSCGGNQIESLDLSKAPGLKSLSCGGNNITALDITPCSGLNSLWISSPLTLKLTQGQKSALIDTGCLDPNDNNPGITLEVIN